jgi:hypothetical protein
MASPNLNWILRSAAESDVPRLQEPSDYHLIVDCQSQETLEEALGSMKEHYKKKPHRPPMTMVSDFKVDFSLKEDGRHV